MNQIKVVDVSLRDGGHRNCFNFSDEQLQHILFLLDNSGIDFIEIGYRNGLLSPMANIGRAGLCDKFFLELCQNSIKKAAIAVMVHPENVSKEDLLDLKNHNVSLLRICISKNELAKAIPIIKLAKNINMPVSANFIHMTYYNDKELDTALIEVAKCQPDMIYLADSNGSIFPERITTIFNRYIPLIDIPFGFHAHDNLGLAQANVIAALASGVQLIDMSLAGMGKGIGNLREEFFIAYLYAKNNKKYCLESILKASNYMRNKLQIGHEPIDLDEFIRGISNLSTADLAASKIKPL